MKNTVLSIVILITTFFSLYSQDVNFTGSAPKYVKVGEQFQLQYSVNARIDDFSPPSFNDFDFLGGPMQSTSSSISTINGKTTRSTTYTLIYYLRGTTPGKYTLEPAEAEYKKSKIKSNAVTVEVVGKAPAKTGNSSTTTNMPSANDEGRDLFVGLILDKSSAYVGEQITAWVKVYTKVNISNIDLRGFKGPEFSGFFKQELEVPQLTSLEREKVGNEIYHTGLIKKYIITPQRSGKISIDPFDLTVYQQKRVRTHSIMDDFFGPSYSSVPVTLTSSPKTIKVKPLPENKPAGFSGAVGRFNIKGSVNANKVKTNDAVTFKIVLSGTGNIKLVENLQYDLSALEEYEPVIKTNMNSSGTGGTKVFEYTVIPRYAGKYNIKPFKLVYFDPSSGTYKTIQTQPFELDVEKSEGDTSGVMVSNLSKKDVELLGSDIRFIKTETKLKKHNNYLVDNITLYLIYLISLLLFVLIVLIKRKQIKNNADIVRTKNRKASRMAQKRLKLAKKLLTQQNYDNFYEELSRAMWGYISDKLNIPVSVLSAERAKSALMEKGVGNELVDELLQLISDCEFTRYAASNSSKSPDEMYKDGVKLILKVDQKI